MENEFEPLRFHPKDCDCIRCLLRRILVTERAILATFYPITAVITQGEDMLTGTITGLLPGASDQFFCTPTDVNGNADQLPAGSPPPVFTASDPGVTIAPPAVADPTGNSCTVTAPTSATAGGNFTLTWTGQFTPAGATSPTIITATATVPYLAPPVDNPTGGVISQGSPAAASANAKGGLFAAPAANPKVKVDASGKITELA